MNKSVDIQQHTYVVNGKLSTRKVTKQIILHCSATREGKDYTVDTIDRWHKERAFSCIGYHFVIYRDGTIVRGRAENAVGAHCSGQNSNSIGICYIGGLAEDGKTAKDTRTTEQKDAMNVLLCYLMSKYNITMDNVHGHYEYAAKACPSFKIEDWRKEYLKWLTQNDDK